MKILVINPYGLGDVLFSLPMVQSLKYYFPPTKIFYLCNKRVYPLLRHQTGLDFIYIFEKDDWRDKFYSSRIKTIRDFLNFLKDIKKNKFDLVFDLSLVPEFGFFSWLSGVKLRLGYAYKKRGIFLNKKIRLISYQDKHMVEYYLSLLELLNLKPIVRKIKINLPLDIRVWAENEVSILKKNYGLVISLIPGGGASWAQDAYKKLWPPEKFKGLLSLITEEIKASIVLLGDERDAERFRGIKLSPKILNYLGKTDLLKFAGLMSVSDFVITNDGGPLHLAVGLGVPTLSIFGPVSEDVYGPYPSDRIHRVVSLKLPCRPCYRNFKIPECDNYHCLNAITVEEVFRNLKQQLSLVLSRG